MSTMDSVRRRKFTFDIPRLKIGQSSTRPVETNRAVRQHLDNYSVPVDIDSPPPTPKSVRPPLEAHTDAELRAACAYVLQNFKPSHIVYAEQYGNRGAQSESNKPQLDYAAIRHPVHKVQHAAPPPHYSTLPQTNPRSHRAASESQSTGVEKLAGLNPDKFRYKPDVATEDLFRHEESSKPHVVRLRRADEIMMPAEAQSPVPRVTPTPVQKIPRKHVRAASQPVHGMALTSHKKEPGEETEAPHIAPCAASSETVDSTPDTNTTDEPWSEKASTALTSVELTPAQDGSNRTSSQAAASDAEDVNVAKAQPLNSDWFRSELEKHKRAQETTWQREPVKADADTTTKAQHSTKVATSPKVLSRKPVPQRADSAQELRPSRVDSVQSPDMSPFVEKAKPEPRPEMHRSISRRGRDVQRPESRQVMAPERPPSRARSISRHVKNCFRSPSAHVAAQPHAESRPAMPERPPSRAESISHHVREYFRPSTATGYRRPSVDTTTRSRSRARSIDSTHSGQSQSGVSFRSAASKIGSWKPFHHSKASQSSPEVSRPGSAQSNHGSRRHGSVKRETSGRSKHMLDLNRELPPLPGLDQWKPSTSPPVTALGSTSTLVSPVSPPSEFPTSPHFQSHGFSPMIGTDEREEIIAARMGAPTPPRGHRNHESRSSFLSQPLDCPPPLPRHTHGDGARPRMPSTTNSGDSVHGSLRDRRHSRSMHPGYPADLDHGSYGGTPAGLKGAHVSTQAAVHRKAPLVTTPRAQPAATNTPQVGLRKRPSILKQFNKSTTAVNSTTPNPKRHSYSSSFSKTQQKYSMDDYPLPMFDGGKYQNVVEITAAHAPLQRSVTPGPTGTTPSDKSTSKKWWQRKEKAAPNWMDQVVKSGSRSGMMLQDSVADAPIVRY